MGTTGFNMTIVIEIVAVFLVIFVFLFVILPGVIDSSKDSERALHSFACACSGIEGEDLRLEVLGFRRAVAKEGTVFGGTLISVCNCGDDEIALAKVQLSYEVWLNEEKIAEGTKGFPSGEGSAELLSSRGVIFNWDDISSNKVKIDASGYGSGQAIVRLHHLGEERSVFSWRFDYLGS